MAETLIEPLYSVYQETCQNFLQILDDGKANQQLLSNESQTLILELFNAAIWQFFILKFKSNPIIWVGATHARVSAQPYPASDLPSVGDEDFIKGLLRGNRLSVSPKQVLNEGNSKNADSGEQERMLLFRRWCCCCCWRWNMKQCSDQHNIWRRMNHSRKIEFRETLE